MTLADNKKATKMRQPNNPNSRLQIGTALATSAKDAYHYARRIEILAAGRGSNDSDLMLIDVARSVSNAASMLQSAAEILLGEKIVVLSREKIANENSVAASVETRETQQEP